MFDTYEPFQQVQKQNFDFKPTRFEIWKGGKMVKSGATNSILRAKVTQDAEGERVVITYPDPNFSDELASTNTFDEFITGNDRLQLITIPHETNVENMAIKMFKMNIGATRQRKSFSSNEPFCCNLFLQNGGLTKLTFAFSNPDKLLEFYQDRDDSFNFHKDQKHRGHDPIIQFFSRNRFGTNNPVMTFLSVLSPIDRCVILEELYDPFILDSVLNDKLLLAYVTSGKSELAGKVIENAMRNGEGELNIWGLREKLNVGLAPVRNGAERIAIYKDFQSKTRDAIELEFLNLLIDFCTQHYD